MQRLHNRTLQVSRQPSTFTEGTLSTLCGILLVVTATVLVHGGVS